MVTKKSWNMKNWPKVMEFCDQSWNFSNVAPGLFQICISFATSKKLGIDLESPHCLTLCAKCCGFKMERKDGHGKSRNGHGKLLGHIYS